MNGHLRLQQCHLCFTATFTQHALRQPRPLALGNGRCTLQIGQGKGCSAVAAVVCAEEREQCRILTDRKKLAIAKCPTPRREVAGEYANLSKEWIHVNASCGL